MENEKLRTEIYKLELREKSIDSVGLYGNPILVEKINCLERIVDEKMECTDKKITIFLTVAGFILSIFTLVIIFIGWSVWQNSDKELG